MLKYLIFGCLITLSGFISLNGQTPHDIHLDVPLSIRQEGIILGNGTLGAVIYGSPDREVIELTINSNDHSTMNLGRLILERPEKDYNQFYHRLSLDSAVYQSSFFLGGKKYQRSTFVSHADQALIAYVGTHGKQACDLDITYITEHNHTIKALGNTLVVQGSMDISDDKPLNFCLAINVIDSRGKVILKENKISLQDGSKSMLTITAKTGMDISHELLMGESILKLQDVLLTPFSKLLEKHINHYSPIYKMSSIKLGRNEHIGATTNHRLIAYANGTRDYHLEETIYNLGRYLDISSPYPMVPYIVENSKDGEEKYQAIKTFIKNPEYKITGNDQEWVKNQKRLKNAFNNIFMYEKDGVIYILPSLPKKWRSGSVSGLLTSNGLLIDLVWQKGSLLKANFTASKNTSSKLNINHKDIVLNLESGESKSFNF